MSDELIKALRRIAKVSYGATIEEARSVSKTQREAADLIEQQAARIAELATDLERTRQDRNSAHVQARREIGKEYSDRIADLEAQLVKANDAWLALSQPKAVDVGRTCKRCGNDAHLGECQAKE